MMSAFVVFGEAGIGNGGSGYCGDVGDVGDGWNCLSTEGSGKFLILLKQLVSRET